MLQKYTLSLNTQKIKRIPDELGQYYVTLDTFLTYLSHV
jgi:hypothetical protein